MKQKIWRYGLLMLIRGSTITIKFGLGFFIARFIGLSELGAYGLVVALSFTLPILFSAGLSTAIARNLVDAKPEQMAYDIKHYLGWIVLCYAFALIAILTLSNITEFGEYKGRALIILLIIMCEHLAMDASLLLNNLHKSQSANIFGLIQAAAWVIPFVSASFLFEHLRNLDSLLFFWAIGSLLTAIGVSSLFMHWPWRSTSPLNISWYRNQIKNSTYLYAADVIGTISQFSDRYIIAFFIGLEQAGIYTLFFQLANAVFTLISSSVVNANRPKLITSFKSKNYTYAASQLRKIRLEATGFGVVLSIITGFVFYYVAPLLNRPSVLSSMPLMWLTFLAIILKIWCLNGFIELYARSYDRTSLGLNAITFVMISITSICGIYYLGIYGIPLSLCITYAIVSFLIYKTIIKINSTADTKVPP